MVARNSYYTDSTTYTHTPEPKPQIDMELKIGIDIVLPFNNEFTLLWFRDGDFICDLVLFGRHIFEAQREKK